MTQPLAWAAGQMLPASNLAISPIDAGFVLGITVAEQIRTFGGRLFRIQEHLARLEHALPVVGVDPGFSIQQLTDAAEELVAHNHPLLADGDDLGLSILVTPGQYAGFGGTDAEPTVAMHTYPLPFERFASTYRDGQALVTTPVEQVSPRCWPTELKCRSRMHYYLADRYAARIEPGSRAVMLDAEGFVAETSTANLVLHASNEGLVSPPESKVLPGISLAMLAELAATSEIPLVRRDIRPEQLTSASEILLTSTSCCLLPVTRFNGRPIDLGRPGPLFERLITAWSDQVGLDIREQAARFASRS